MSKELIEAFEKKVKAIPIGSGCYLLEVYSLLLRAGRHKRNARKGIEI